MAIVRITVIPENRREAIVEVEKEVRGFRAATAVIARDLRLLATNDFRNRVMRQWSKDGKAGGFAVRNSPYASHDDWVLFEYSEGK
jgi:hypothetical protein